MVFLRLDQMVEFRKVGGPASVAVKDAQDPIELRSAQRDSQLPQGHLQLQPAQLPVAIRVDPREELPLCQVVSLELIDQSVQRIIQTWLAPNLLQPLRHIAAPILVRLRGVPLL